MSHKYLLEYLARAEMLSQVKNLLLDLGGLNFYLLDPGGKYLEIVGPKGSPSVPRCPELLRENPCGINDCRRSFHCEAEALDCLERIAQTKQPEDLACPMGRGKIFVPVVLSAEVVAFLCAGENGSCRFNAHRIKSVKMFLKKLADTVLKDELTSFSGLKTHSLTHRQKLLQKIIADMKNNYHKQDLSLREVSQRNAVSYHHLSRIFKKELKTGFSKYRNKIRMEAASRLLRDRSLSVGEIAHMCGFDDPAYFCKVFKMTFGCPPLDFKQK